MKATKENIQFIDTYLENSDVVYIDIRYEMIDHIATGVEEMMEKNNIDFYNAFKDYMVVHKKAILKNNKSRYSYSWDTIKQFLFFLVKPYQLTIALLLFVFYKSVDFNSYFNKDFTVNNLFFLLFISIALFQIGYFDFYLKKKFYSIESSVVIINVIYWFKIFFLPIFGRKNVSEVTLTIFSYLIIGYVIYFIQQLRKFNQKQFQLTQ